MRHWLLLAGLLVTGMLLLAACSGNMPIQPDAATMTATAEAVAAEVEAAALAVSAPSVTTTVTIRSGALAGAVVNGVTSFKGIPFAQPPVGELRWRAPAPIAPWQGVREAYSFAPDCMQALGIEQIATVPAEDCLYLNLWMPEGAQPGDNLPVAVWLHGGGYVGGGPSIPFYDGSAFARQGIVLVAPAYRLARFGFFAHPALARAAEDKVLYNYGYLDQLAALAWVQANVAQFGGDPGHVTLMGESAGGASILHHITSPLVPEGLFQQAVVLSGDGREGLLDRPLQGNGLFNLGAEFVDQGIAVENGIFGSTANTLRNLRALAPAALSGDYTLEKMGIAKLLGGPVSGIPIIEGNLIVGQPQEHFLAGTAKTLPILIGTTAIEIPMHFPPQRRDPLAWFGDDAELARQLYGAPAQLNAESTLRLLLAIGADMTMHEPARFVARQMTEAGFPAYLYRFTYTAESTRPETIAQSHAGELPWFFDALAARYGDAVTANDSAMAQAFNTYVANFIKTGNPNDEAGTLPVWPQFDAAEHTLMHFSLEDGPLFMADPRPTVELVERARAAHGE